jgi:hypothetical protein
MCSREEAEAAKAQLAAGLREKEGMDDAKLEKWFTKNVRAVWIVADFVPSLLAVLVCQMMTGVVTGVGVLLVTTSLCIMALVLGVVAVEYLIGHGVLGRGPLRTGELPTAA